MSTPTSFAELLRQSRESDSRTLREVAGQLNVDVSLVSKWERGERKPNRDEVNALARYFKTDRKAWVVLWLRDTVLYSIGDDEFALDALKAAEAQVKYQAKNR